MAKGNENTDQDHWAVTVEQRDEMTARIIFTPPGASAGPTFAIRDPSGFAPVALDEAGMSSICAGRVRVSVAQDGRGPHRDNLCIRWASGGRERVWRPGDLDDENLGAPFVALDNLWRDYIPTGVRPADPTISFDAFFWDTSVLTIELELAITAHVGKSPTMVERNEEVRRLLSGQTPTLLPEWPERVLAAADVIRHSPPGFLSRSGLCLFRDDTPPWDADDEWVRPHLTPRPTVYYLIHHDCQWKRAVRALVELLGPIPRVDDRFCGVWYSNYTAMGQAEFERVAQDFAAHELPLDLVSVDMDWHGKDWYGYAWNHELFPDPPAFVRWLNQQDLRATFNVHPLYIPASHPGVEEFKRASGHSGHVFGEEGDWHAFQKNCLKIDISDRRQADAYLRLLHTPIEDTGCSFWWIDGSVRRDDGRDECTWLNHAYRAHLARNPERMPIVLARTGGLGAHRDAIVFTGDACSQWEVLAFEVETVVRAAGALLAYISHDIGGFYHDPADRSENKPPDDLYLRWVQFGCLSPIMRLHSFNGVREPWRFAPRVFAAARRFMTLRLRLYPYLSNLLDEAHVGGVGPARPMWFEFDDEDAFSCLGQYMLGETLLVAPVVREDGSVRTWLPPGQWHHAFGDRSEQGPRWLDEQVAADEMSLWLRDGHALKLAAPRTRVSEAKTAPTQVVTGPNWARED